MNLASGRRRRHAFLLLFWRTARAHSLPELRTMDENTWIALESQPHSAATNLEHGHGQQELGVVQTSDGNGFQLLSGQDQHRKTPFMTDGLVRSRSTYPPPHCGRAETPAPWFRW